MRWFSPSTCALGHESTPHHPLSYIWHTHRGRLHNGHARFCITGTTHVDAGWRLTACQEGLSSEKPRHTHMSTCRVREPAKAARGGESCGGGWAVDLAGFYRPNLLSRRAYQSHPEIEEFQHSFHQLPSCAQGAALTWLESTNGTRSVMHAAWGGNTELAYMWWRRPAKLACQSELATGLGAPFPPSSI